jgi:hypothetical protein
MILLVAESTALESYLQLFQTLCLCCPEGLLKLEVDEYPPEIFIILFDAVI